MKIPSLMRVPKYKRFNFEPRHYDPVKEELKNRTETIKQQLNKETSNETDEDAVKQRISQAFVRDKRKSSAGVNGLQLGIVFLISVTFIAFLYIGFYAFLITGVIIFLYILQQKGVFDTRQSQIATGEETIDSPHSRITGQFREGKYFVKERGKKRNGWYKLFLLVVTAGVAAAYYFFQINGIMALILIFILLILFIKESNKTQ